jgi:hypothetical protein
MAITIYSPVPGDQVPSSQFFATGTAPAGQPLYAYIAQQGGQPYIGTLINYPSNFVFRFTNVPVGANYNLCVTGFGNPPEQHFVNGITVVAG